MEIPLQEILSGGNLVGLIYIIAELRTAVKYYGERIERLESYVLKKA